MVVQPEGAHGPNMAFGSVNGYDIAIPPMGLLSALTHMGCPVLASAVSPMTTATTPAFSVMRLMIYFKYLSHCQHARNSRIYILM